MRALAAVAVLLVGFGLRARALNDGNLGFDGGLAVALAASPLTELIELSARDVHPPLYYLLLGGWWRLAGPGTAAALWPSLALGALAIAAAWRLGRRIGPAASLATAGLLALSPLHVQDGMAARDFAALVPLTLLTSALFLEWLAGRRPDRRPLLAGLYLAGLLTSYYFALTIAAHAVVLLWRRGAGRRWLAAAAPGLVALTGWALFSFARIGGAVAGGARPTAGEPPPLAPLLSGLLQATAGGAALPAGVGGAGAWAVMAAWGAAVTFLPALRRRAGRSDARPAGSADAWLLAIVGLELALAGASAVVLLWLRDAAPARYALVALPFAVALAGLGLSALLPLARALAPAFVFFAVAPLLAGLYAGWRPVELPPTFFDPRGLAQALDREARAGDQVVFISLEQAGYYAALAGAPRPWRVVPVGPRYLEGDLAAEAAAKVDGSASRALLVLYQGGIAPRHRLLRDYLAARGYPAGERELADSRLLFYLMSDAEPREMLAAPVRYPGATLEAVQVAGRPGWLGVSLSWRAAGPLDRAYSVFVHAIDGRGEKVGQHDGGPADGARETNSWRAGERIVDRHGLELGPTAQPPITLAIGLYGPDGQRLRAESGDDAVRVVVKP
jgi:mannosyltransferase